VWLGASDKVREGHFVWRTSMKPMTYSHWTRNEPNNFRERENCVQMVKTTGRWNDIACANNNWTTLHTLQETICEKLYDCE